MPVRFCTHTAGFVGMFSFVFFMFIFSKFHACDTVLGYFLKKWFALIFSEKSVLLISVIEKS